MKWSLDYLDLRSICVDLLKNLWVILLAAAAAYLAVTGGYQLRYVPEYTSSATLAVTVKGNNGGSYTSLNTAKEMAAVFGEVFQSDALRKLIAEDMGVASVEGTISIELVSETNLMLLTVTSDSPRHAYQMAQSALNNYNRVSDYLFSNARLDTLKSPTIPYSPSNPLQMSKLRRMGALAAAGVVTALMVLTSYLRFTVKKRGLAKKQLDGTILGSIPYERKTHSLREVLKKKRNKRPLLISSLLVGTPFIESTKKIATHLEQHMRKHGQQVLLVTSVEENEGKSSVTANLALALAEKGKRVLLLDTDLKKPALYRIFERKDSGLSLSDCIARCSIPQEAWAEEARNLMVLHQYRAMANSGSLLAEEGMKRLLDTCREEADYILLDTPPMNVAADTEILLQYADVAVMVVRQDWADAGEINDVADILRRGKADFAGYILNAFHPEFPWLSESRHTYGYYGSYRD